MVLLPRLEYRMVVEWTHRWVAAIVGLLIILTVAAWRSRPPAIRKDRVARQLRQLSSSGSRRGSDA